MGIHCPTCSCSQCQIQENRYSEISGPVTYVDRNGNRYQDGKYVGHQSEIDTSNDWINERNISDLPHNKEQTIWQKGQPNYPGSSWEGSQAISHVTQQGNSQTFYVDRSLPPQNIRGFQQTYHQDPNQRWERMPDSPLPEEMQRQVNQQMHGLAEQLGRQYGAQNVQVHQAFIAPDQLPPEQQQQIRQYQQQAKGQPTLQPQPILQQPKQGFWDRLRGNRTDATPTQQQQSQLVRSPSQSPVLTQQPQQLQEKAVLLFKQMWIAKRQIGTDNDRYRQDVLAANEQIKQKQGEAIAVATKAIATATNAQEKLNAISARLNLATNQPKLLPPAQGEKVNVRMGQKQPKQQQTLHAGQRDNPAIRGADRGLYLPVGGGTSADRIRNQRATAKSWMD